MGSLEISVAELYVEKVGLKGERRIRNINVER